MEKINSMQVTKRPYNTGQEEEHTHNLKPPEKMQLLFNESLPKIRRNQITGEWENNSKILTEEDCNSYLLTFQCRFKEITEPLFWRHMKSNNVPWYNPIHDFFKSHELPKSRGYIRNLAATLETDTGLSYGQFSPTYAEHFITKWIVGAVAQAFGKGVNPLMLVLAGTKQNTGKTTWFRNLLPNELKPYLAEPKGLSEMKDADLGMLLCENLIVFDDEMTGRSWRDWQKMKSMLSMDSYTMRRPYDKRQKKYPRIASLCATNNQLDLLGDTTGNRRLIPIHVLSINHEKYNFIDKTALWMEAYDLFLNGYDHNLHQEDIKMLNDCTKDFEIVDEIEELIQEYFEPPSKETIGRLTATQLSQKVHLLSGVRPHPNKLGERLRKLGYVQLRDNPNGSRTWIIDLKPKYL